jgi:hypothetical protein
MELSNIQKRSFAAPCDFLKPVWSKQHGAYVTLITSWLIGTLLSHSLSILHIAVLILLLSGFNATEILIDSLKRRSLQSQRKLFWMGIYGIVSIASTYVLWSNSPFFPSMLPVFVIGGVLFTILSVKRLQKTIPAELLSFILFSAAGLLAYNPTLTPDTNFIITLWILLSAYFCLSVFHVKYRIKEVTAKPLFVYIIIAMTTVLLAGGFSIASLLVSTLIIFKTVPLLASPEAYRALPIKHIGYIEMVMQGMFIIIIVLTLQ